MCGRQALNRGSGHVIVPKGLKINHATIGLAEVFVEIWKHASTASTGWVGTGATDAGRKRTFGFGHGGDEQKVVVGGIGKVLGKRSLLLVLLLLLLLNY